ncbi:MAG: hypothetical protein V3U27_00610 [Candidatus Tectomicrobia bacterium]
MIVRHHIYIFLTPSSNDHVGLRDVICLCLRQAFLGDSIFQSINPCIPKNDLEPTDERGKVGKRSLAVSALQGIPFDFTEIVGHPIYTLFQSLYTHLGMTLGLALRSDLPLHLFQSRFGAVLRLSQTPDQLS